jgi:hypothetical protein
VTAQLFGAVTVVAAIAAAAILAALHIVDGEAALALIATFAGGAGVHGVRS